MMRCKSHENLYILNLDSLYEVSLSSFAVHINIYIVHLVISEHACLCALYFDLSPRVLQTALIMVII